jgi:outer membrane protein
MPSLPPAPKDVPTIVAAWLVLFLGCSPLRADEPLTLEKALAEAHQANARLPAPFLDIDLAREHLKEAQAERWLKASLDGDVVYAPPGYDAAVSNAGEVRVQVTGQQPLLDGGGRKAAVRKARAELAAAGARYRVAEKDVDLDVRSRLAEFASAENEVEVRGEGRERLRRYLTSLESRQAAGQGIAADVLKTRVRVASEEADLTEALQRLGEARLELNDLLGRDPAAPLEMAPLPDPTPSLTPAEKDPWLRAPEVVAAKAQTDSAEAALSVTRSERSLHLTANADAGLWGSDTNSTGLFDRLKHDFGYSLTLNFNWPLFDLGGFRARVAQSSLELRQAQQEEEVEKRRARLGWHEAHQSLLSASRQIEILAEAVPEARDSSLATESRYLGGAANALDVLEAHAASVEAAVRLGEATMRYRIAEALEIRWGAP